jgi:hypothetical protein
VTWETPRWGVGSLVGGATRTVGGFWRVGLGDTMCAGSVGVIFRRACVWAIATGLVLGALDSRCAAETRCAVLEVFLKGDSERSKEAREFVEKTYTGKRGLTIAYRDVVESEKDLDRFYKLAEHFKIEKPGLPAFYVSSRFEYGWEANTTPARLEEALTVEVFVRQGCPRCAAAKPIIFNQIAPTYPAYKFVEKDLVTSAEAGRRLTEVSTRYHVQAASVPALHMCGRLMVGYIDPQTSFRQWNDVLKGATVVCAEDKDKSAANSPAPQRLPVSRRASSWFGSVAYADEPPSRENPAISSVAAEVSDEPPPRPSPGRALPPEVAAAPSDVAADAPPPRPRRELPPEVSSETDLQPVVDVPEPPSDVVELGYFGEVNWKQIGLPLFTIAVGLVDGFNPCAMWVLLFLLSLLVNLQNRWKILGVAGTFVFISGLAYFLFMAGWLSVLKYANQLGKVQIALGLIGVVIGVIHIKDFFIFKQGVSLSIPESAKPKLYERMRQIVHAESLLAAILGAGVLAVLVNFIELLCTAGLPAMYTQILTQQHLPAWQNFLYLLLYIAAYMFDDSIMVTLAVVTLGKRKLQEKGGRVLKLVSGVVILAIGLTMIFKPEWLV